MRWLRCGGIPLGRSYAIRDKPSNAASASSRSPTGVSHALMRYAWAPLSLSPILISCRKEHVMQTYRLMWKVLMVAIAAWVGWEIPQALAQPARVPQTGQTQCWDINGNPTPCDGTGEDGDYQAGVEWPRSRFTD